MAETLRALLTELRPDAGDHLVFLGDLVDKGPHPADVLAQIRALDARPDLRRRNTTVSGSGRESA